MSCFSKVKQLHAEEGMAFSQGVGWHSLVESRQNPHTALLFALGTLDLVHHKAHVKKNSLYCCLDMLHTHFLPLWFCSKLATIWVTHKIGQNIVFQYNIYCFQNPEASQGLCLFLVVDAKDTLPCFFFLYLIFLFLPITI